MSERQPKRHLLNNPNVARGKRQVRRVWCFGDVMRERIGQLGPKQTSLLRIACNTGGETKDVREKQVAALGKLPPASLCFTLRDALRGVGLALWHVLDGA